MNAYVRLCESCFEDLYRAAYLAMGDTVVASELVEKTCVQGVYLCARLRDLRAIKIVLTGEMYRRGLEKLLTFTPKENEIEKRFPGISASDRLLLMIRYKSGLRLDELSIALSASPEDISKRVSRILCAARLEAGA